MNKQIYSTAERYVWIAWSVVALLCCYLFFTMASAVERGLFPVLSRFDVLSIEHDAGSIKVSGTLIKERHCEIIGIHAVSDAGSHLQVEYLDRPVGAPAYTRPVGASSWGPWRIYPAGARYVTLMAEHQCHFLWSTTTVLAAFQTKPRYAP